jgi:SIR2-like domain
VTISDLKNDLQQHISDGLVTIVGSGLSAACGMPTMGQLGQYLLDNMPASINTAHRAEWELAATQLKSGKDLETVLRTVDEGSPLLEPIIDLTSALMRNREKSVLAKILSEQQKIAFERLLPHITFSNARTVVITPNYERLLEFAIERAGLGLDTGFTGQYFGVFNPKQSKDSLKVPKLVSRQRENVQFQYRTHIVIAKPHGSLDWYLIDGSPVRCAAELPLPSSIITPGRSKYRKGYESPFDHHRSIANDAIDQAARFLIVGYGFNDDQLETHLRARLRSGVPTVVLAMELTANARKVAQENKNLTAIERGYDAGKEGSLVWKAGKSTFFLVPRLWDLATFITEVLE